MRGPEIPYAKPFGASRIVLLGDSHTFGFGVPEEFHFATLLEGYLPRTQVVNMGDSGYGIDQELLELIREGFKYQPDLVLANDPTRHPNEAANGIPAWTIADFLKSRSLVPSGKPFAPGLADNGRFAPTVVTQGH